MKITRSRSRALHALSLAVVAMLAAACLIGARSAARAEEPPPCGVLQQGLGTQDFDGQRADVRDAVSLFADGVERIFALAPRAGGPRVELRTRCSVREASARRATFTVRFEAHTAQGTRANPGPPEIAWANATPVWRREARFAGRTSPMRVSVQWRARRSAPSAMMMCALRVGMISAPILGIDSTPTIFAGELSNVFSPTESGSVELDCGMGDGSFLARNAGTGSGPFEMTSDTTLYLDVTAETLGP